MDNCPFSIKTVFNQNLCELSCEHIGRTVCCSQVKKEQCDKWTDEWLESMEEENENK